MGMQAENTYVLTIPLAAVVPIIEEWGARGWNAPYDKTPEGLVLLLTDEFGNDDVSELPDFQIKFDQIHVEGYTYGRLGDAATMAALLASHGATGIVYGDCDGMLFLTELVDGEVKEHGGIVVFPSYTGDLYQV